MVEKRADFRLYHEVSFGQNSFCRKPVSVSPDRRHAQVNSDGSQFPMRSVKPAALCTMRKNTAAGHSDANRAPTSAEEEGR